MANDRVDYLQLDIDRIAAGRAGMPIDQLQDAMRAQIEGVRAGVVAEACAGSDRHSRQWRRHRADPAGFRRSDLSFPSGQIVRPATSPRWSASTGRSSSSMKTARALPWCRPSFRGAIWSAMSIRPRPTSPRM
jgi:cobalt-zinc-cadmium resistance protein CzcA